MSHTPGPWMVGKKDNPIGYLPIFARTGVTKINCIAKTDAHEVGFGISQEEMESNARLIAAAPKLLAAHHVNANLDVDTIRNEGRLAEVLRQIVTDARAAIADVEGE